MDDAQMRQELLNRINQKRSSIRAFVRRERPRNNRLSSASIIFSALAAALTAGPGLGGEKFTESVQHLLALSSDSTVWRLLCLGAAGVSVMAAVTTNLTKSQEAVLHLNAAETCAAELDVLEMQLSVGQLPVQDAAKLYQQTVTKIPFVTERH